MAMPQIQTEQWQVLGPFQIGTREAPWGADPLEYHGGFRNLEYDSNATFRSSIATNGTVHWSIQTANVSHPDEDHGLVELSVGFPEYEKDWKFLQSVYGWAALQWQGWARGEIFIHPESTGPFLLHTEGIIEYWIDDTHYFGGDVYEFGKAPVTLRLEPGSHRIDIRLVRDVRASGAVGAPNVDVKLRLERSKGELELLYGYGKNVLMSEIVGGRFGPLASPYASITVRNDAETDMYVHAIGGMGEECVFEMLSQEPVKLVPGQTRPIGFKVGCIPSYDKRLQLEIQHTIHGVPGMLTRSTSIWPTVRPTMREPHRVTFKHPSGKVSYAILRPPSHKATEGREEGEEGSLPVQLALHGAGLEADSPEWRRAFDELPDIPAWVLFPTGVTPWSGDDWHMWGWADVEAAIAMIPDWIEQVEWKGPGVDTSRWLVAGHSNGGQGAWYALTHHFDKIIAAAPISGYSSVQNYVPYNFWHTADPAKIAVMHASMNSYRHDVLLENAKWIPVLQQHGNADDNVPVYHSRLMAQRIREAGALSEYHEVEGKPHYWEGIMTTTPLQKFFKTQLQSSDVAGPSSFSVVVANPAETDPKFGIKVIYLQDPGRLGKIDVSYHGIDGTCTFHTSNVLMWIMPQNFAQCQVVTIDGEEVSIDAQSHGGRVWFHDGRVWQQHDSLANASANSASPMRDQSQLGHMDAILRTKEPFTVVRHSSDTAHIAMQVSRNLHQYFYADVGIIDSYDALGSAGNVISLATGPSLPGEPPRGFPIGIANGQITINLSSDPAQKKTYSEIETHGLGAIFIRPLPGGRLELVIWGKDTKSLETAARLASMMPGSGQPDFVVVDDRMLWKGVDGARAMGFFGTWWEVSGSSVLG